MADNTTAFVEDINSLDNMLKILTMFEIYAGLKLNKTKTEAMWLGRNGNNIGTPLGIKWVKEVHSLGIFFSYDTDYVMQKNFTDKIKDFKRILDMWMQRDLSFIGKITILKSLAFSKIIYQCAVITPPPNFIEEIKDLAFSFVWHNKPDKIKRDTLISDYKNGGLKMLDIDSFVKAQKAMWVKKFISLDNAKWKALLKLNLEDLLGLDTLKCSLDCSEKPANFPNFYWQMICAWHDVKKITNTVKTAMDVRREVLWLNKNIKINKIQIKWNLWYKNGIKQIHDIVYKNGDFLSAKDIEQKFNITCDILKYNKLKDAIPREWRKILKTIKIPSETINPNEQIYMKIGKKEKPLNLIKNKDLYWILVNQKMETPIIISKYKRELGIQEDQWDTIFTIPKIIRNTKIRAFQYKLLYKLTPCNKYLKQIKKSDTEKCNWYTETDDTVHFYAECHLLQHFWSSFATWYAGISNKTLAITLENIIVGVINKNKDTDTLNACILLAKWHIYKQKLNQSEIFFYKFL